MKEKESNKGYYTLIILGSALLLLSAAYLLLQFVRGYDWCQSEFFGANGSAGNIGDFFCHSFPLYWSFTRFGNRINNSNWLRKNSDRGDSRLLIITL